VVQSIDIYRSERELTRTGLELKQLAGTWSRTAHGKRYVETLLTFLNRKQNRNTQRSYAFAILEFFGWYEVKKGRIPVPHEVRRVDAYAFSQYLQERTVGLDEYRLAQDPERSMDLTIYRFVKGSPGARIDAVRKKLLADSRFTEQVTFLAGARKQTMRVLSIEAAEPRGDELDAYIAAHGRPPPNGLDLRLACLVDHNLLRRSPSVRQIRTQQAGLDIEKSNRAQIDWRIDPAVFAYYVDTHTDAVGAERANTVMTRLGALSSFWKYLVEQSTENTPGAEPLLKYNIWTEPRGSITKTARSRSRASRELKTPSRELFVRTLATTFERSHGEQAYEAADASLEGADVSRSATGDPSLYDLRDRAVLVFVYWTGARADELRGLLRGALQPDGLVTIIGKGDETRSFLVPSPARRAIVELQDALSERAEKASPEALVHQLLAPNSPLFPPLKLWGRNAALPLRGLSEQGFGAMLHRRALRAGMEREGHDWRRMHPHGLRHLAALQARERGVDVAVIQATLGHSSLATTGLYLEVRDPRQRSLMPHVRPVPEPPAPPAMVVEAPPVGEEVEEIEEFDLEPEDEEFDYDVPAEEEDEEIDDFREKRRQSDIPLRRTFEVEAPSETLVGVGEEPTPHEEAIELAEESAAVQKLLAIYENKWGEKGQRSNLVTSGGGLLAYAYVGKRSGLPWWQGGGGKMKGSYSYAPNPDDFPAMPVLSPAQFLGQLGSGIECEEPLCLSLAALYEKWFDDPKRGPTAARALSEWVFTAATITLETDEVVRTRHGSWVDFDAPLEETVVRGNPRVLREHLDDAVVAWFERTAWQHRTSAESRMARGTELQIPEWYGHTDPLAQLPKSERGELLDWLQVFVGMPPLDTTPRFDGLSRAQIGKFLSQLCAYETLSTDPDLRKSEKAEYLEPIDAGISELVSKLTKGRVKDWSYTSTKKRRKEETVRAEMAREAAKRQEDDASREKIAASYSKYLAPHLMEVVGELFGEKAGTDPILELFALCTAGAPLKDVLDTYKGLFRVRGGTISHTPEFVEQFGAATGQHSDCVARRLARHIYEEGKAPQWHKRRNWPESTIPYLESMTAYRVPCPASQEESLRKIMPSAKPMPIYEQWRDAGNRLYAAAIPEHEGELLGVMAEEQARGGARPTRLQTGHRENLRVNAARRFTPNPVALAAIILAMRRASR
jgi:integrase